MRRTLVVACTIALLAVGACSSDPQGRAVGGPPSATSTATPTAEATGQEVARARHPIEPLDVTDLWVRRRGEHVWVTDERPPQPRATSPVSGMLPWPVPSLVPGRTLLALGGDGATLFPLLRVLSSTDDGATWATYEVPEVDGERRYTTGHVLLSDGRLLVVVEAWSDDRLGRHSSRHHGFFVSDRTDLGALRPVEPTFVPPLAEPPRRGWDCCLSLHASTDPDPVIWTTTWDRRLYYSVDDGRTFRELPVPRS